MIFYILVLPDDPIAEQSYPHELLTFLPTGETLHLKAKGSSIQLKVQASPLCWQQPAAVCLSPGVWWDGGRFLEMGGTSSSSLSIGFSIVIKPFK